MYMLDTDICIYVLKKRPSQLHKKFKAVRGLCISSVTYAELCYGIENSPAQHRSERWVQLQSFIRNLNIEPWTADQGQAYGQIRADLKRKGTPIGNNDLLIAAHAQSLGLTLVTNNTREFQRVENLPLENWVK